MERSALQSQGDFKENNLNSAEENQEIEMTLEQFLEDFQSSKVLGKKVRITSKIPGDTESLDFSKYSDLEEVIFVQHDEDSLEGKMFVLSPQQTKLEQSLKKRYPRNFIFVMGASECDFTQNAQVSHIFHHKIPNLSTFKTIKVIRHPSNNIESGNLLPNLEDLEIDFYLANQGNLKISSLKKLNIHQFQKLFGQNIDLDLSGLPNLKLLEANELPENITFFLSHKQKELGKSLKEKYPKANIMLPLVDLTPKEVYKRFIENPSLNESVDRIALGLTPNATKEQHMILPQTPEEAQEIQARLFQFLKEEALSKEPFVFHKISFYPNYDFITHDP